MRRFDVLSLPLLIAAVVCIFLTAILILGVNAWRWTIYDATIPLCLWLGSAYAWGMTAWAARGGRS